jgi:mannosyltransferase
MSVDTLRPPTALPRESVAPPATTTAAARAARDALPAWAILAVLSLLALVSVWLRTRALHAHYWVDEGLSVGIAHHPLSEIPSVLRQDGSPPLYYVLLHIWIGLFGSHEAATHALSLTFALLTIPVAYWAGATMFTRRVGLISAALAATLPYLTTYAQETRMYSLLALLSLIVAGSFVQTFVRRRRRYLPVFALSMTASLYTHNWALFLALMTAVAFLVCARDAGDQRRALWRDGLIAFAAIAVMYAPWVPTVVYQAGHTGAPWALAPVVWSLTQGGYFLVGGRGAAVALLLGAGAGLLALRGDADRRDATLLTVKCLLVLGFGTLLTAWAYSKSTPAWAFRYLAVIVGPLIPLVAFGLQRAGRLGLVALALVLCFWLFDPHSTNVNAKSNIATAIAHVRADIPPGTLVLSTQPEQVPTADYYLGPGLRYGTPLGPVRDPRVVDWENALARLRQSSVPSVLMPMVDSLRPGQRVALIVATRMQKTPLWLTLILRDSSRWAHALEHDRLLRRVAGSSAGAGAAGLPVRGTVFVRR